MGQDINYKIRRNSRAKNLTLSVHLDERIVVTAPKRTSMWVIRKFIYEKRDWITDKLEYIRGLDKKGLLISSEEDFKKYKVGALELAISRLEHFNKVYNFSFNKITIKNQKTLWGSCSRRKNLNFSYKIALLPKELSDYIIVHELCHLGEFNHSKKFWNLVEITIPNHKDLRKKIKVGGLT